MPGYLPNQSVIDQVSAALRTTIDTFFYTDTIKVLIEIPSTANNLWGVSNNTSSDSDNIQRLQVLVNCIKEPVVSPASANELTTQGLAVQQQYKVTIPVEYWNQALNAAIQVYNTNNPSRQIPLNTGTTNTDPRYFDAGKMRTQDPVLGDAEVMSASTDANWDGQFYLAYLMIKTNQYAKP